MLWRLFLFQEPGEIGQERDRKNKGGETRCHIKGLIRFQVTIEFPHPEKEEKSDAHNH